MNGACSTIGGEEERVQIIVGEATVKEITREKKM
jgi:hypothetical protein